MKTVYVEPPSGEHQALIPQPTDTGQSQQRQERAEVVTCRTISIVLPAYSEEPVIARTVTDCLRAAERFCPNVEVIVVDDGSRDRTGAIVDELAAADPRMVAIHHAPNQGYGAALLTGFAAARGELLFFMDSDGQFDVEDLFNLLRIQEEHPEYVVLGYRERRCDSWLRRVNAWGWKQAVRLVLGLKGVRDVDCAFKLFPTSVVRACGLTARGALINAELLTKLQRMRVPMTQVPVRHYPRTHGAATGANLRVIARAFKELLRLRLTLHRWQPHTGPSQAEPANGGGDTRAVPDAAHADSDQAVVPAVGAPHSPSRDERAAASVLNRLPVPGPVRRIGTWLKRRATPEWAVAGVASALSIGFYAWYAHKGLTLAYNDAVYHIMIARRVVDGRTPGIAQLGTNWLPLHTLLMAPLIWIDVFFRSGFAGAFPSMVAYVIGAVYLFRTGRLLFTSSISGWMVALVFMLNPNMLYMQGTPLTESDLLCTIIVAVYYLLQWSHFYRVSDLVKAAAAVTAATLVRYEGWALALAGIAVVMYVAWRRQGRVGAEAKALLFGVMAFAGCVGYLFYNWLLFHDPLEFYRGNYSAAYFQKDIEAAVGLPTHNNLWLSIHIYSQAVIDTVGWPIALVALFGLIYWVFRYRLRTQVVPAYLMLIPFAFNVYSLARGISIIETPEISLYHEPTYFNVRYAMGMIPAIAIFLAPIVVKRRALLIAALGLVVAFGVGGSVLGTPYMLGEPLHGVDVGPRATGLQAGKWLATHYKGGDILISYAPDSTVMFFSGLPDNAFITDSNWIQFQHAVADPQSTVTWIVVSPAKYNPVWIALGHRQDWRQYFVLRQTIGTTQFYERIGST